MTATNPIQSPDSPTPVSSPSTVADPPQSDETKRMAEQARDAIDNNREGFRHKPLDLSPVGKETFDETAEGGTEPTHVPSTGSDRRP